MSPAPMLKEQKRDSSFGKEMISYPLPHDEDEKHLTRVLLPLYEMRKNDKEAIKRTCLCAIMFPLV